MAKASAMLRPLLLRECIRCGIAVPENATNDEISTILEQHMASKPVETIEGPQGESVTVPENPKGPDEGAGLGEPQGDEGVDGVEEEEPGLPAYKKEGNKLVYEFEFSEPDLKFEPTLRFTITREGKDSLIVELRAVDVASLTNVVAQVDKIDFYREREKFYAAMRKRLALMMKIDSISQAKLNDILGMANQAISDQKKSGIGTSSS